MWSMNRRIVLFGTLLSLCVMLSVHSTRAQRVVRMIPDPGAHAVWILEVDSHHPAGPGRLTELREPGTSPASRESIAASPAASNPALPLIRAGDHVFIEQHTAHVDSWLSGVALEPAGLNTPFRLRLSGGQVLRAIAIKAHRVRLVASLVPLKSGSERP